MFHYAELDVASQCDTLEEALDLFFKCALLKRIQQRPFGEIDVISIKAAFG